MLKLEKKGVILFIVIGILMVVVILTTVVLRIIANHARLTHHMVSRIQAQYAAKAGMVYALEKLKTVGVGGWTYSPVNSCPNSTPCSVPGDLGYATPVLAGFPSSIISIEVIFCVPGSRCPTTTSPYCIPPPGSDFCIDSTAEFGYTLD